MLEVREMYVKLVNGEISMQEFEDWCLDRELSFNERIATEEYHYVH